MARAARALVLAGVLAASASGGEAATLAEAQRAYESGSYATARMIWLDLAEAGDPQAAFGLGTLYDLGDGIRADPVAAYCWYRRAAESGLPQAQFNVAVMHDSGRGAPRDAILAGRWYARAAAQGNHRAEYNLGQIYASGEGVPRNEAVAAAWFRAAATGGLQAASDRLAALPRANAAATPKDAEPSQATLDDPGDVAAGDKSAPVALTWIAPVQAVPVAYFVQVMQSGSSGPREVFAGYSDTSAILANLRPGRYAGRVFSVAAAQAHYTEGDWTWFEIGRAPKRVCAASR